ncbi:metallophosphoesterase [Primorskyibacter sp. 2E107]|uniref:metallophosphoesterase n=1 Tax=Primorskyibacter sp. 2E107 TaxID=3403458 RepID=UPI003AF5F261
MANWYTADLHLGHDRIMRICARPFASTAAMTDALITTLQETITPDDDLWIIGDFTFGRNRDTATIRAWFDAIPGRKHLIAGNHDSPTVRALPWASQHELLHHVDRGVEVTLCHYPMVSFPRSGSGSLQLFGHVHDLWPGTRNSVNVGVDQWDFRPVQLEALLPRAASLPLNAHFSDVEFGGTTRVPLPPTTIPDID